MDGKGLEIFLAIAMGQTLSRAAEILNLSQSAVSRRLKQLENELGIVLVDRQQGIKSIQLTEEGEKLLPLAIRWRELQREMQRMQTRNPSYFLTLGSVDSVIVHILPPLFLALRERQVRVNARTLQPSELYRQIESRELDVAVVPVEEHFQHVQADFFMEDRMLVVQAAASAPPPGTVISPDDLDPGKELYVSWGAEYELWHSHIWGTGAPALQTDNVSLVGSLLLCRDMWSIVPASTAPLLREKGLVCHEMAPNPPNRIHYLISHRFPKTSAVAPLSVLRETAAELGFGASRRPAGENA